MRHLFLSVMYFSIIGAVFPQVPDTSLWISNGPVNAIAKQGDTLYIGGSFDYVGKSSGYGIIADTVLKSLNPSFPKINGPVYTVTPDHRGGWYIGGKFSRVGGYVRNSIARIDKNGNVDIGFDANIEGIVYTIATNLQKGANQFVFVGGSFSVINTYPCSNMAVISPYTGKPYNWLPKVNGTIRTICVYSRDKTDPKPSVYIGGDFNRIDVSYSAFVQNIAVLEYPDSANYTVNIGNWNPLADKTVRCIFGWKYYILVGGDFTKIGNRSWSYFSALVDSTGNAANLNFSVNGPVYNIIGSRYILPLLNGPPPSPFYPPLPPYNTFSPTIYIAGEFTSVLNATRNRFAEVEPDMLRLTSLTIPADNKITTVFPSPSGKIYLGGSFHVIGSMPREYFAEYDTSSKQITNWSLSLSNGINAIALSGKKIFAGGNFNSLNGVKRRNIAAIDLVTGKATGFDPDVNDIVNTMLIHKNILYINGNFTKVNNIGRNKLAAFDIKTESLTPWNISTDGTVRTIAADGNNLYLAGYFSKAGTENRNNIACYLLDSGIISKKWNPNVNGTINSILLLNNKMYIGGYFTRVGNNARNYLASIELSRSLATNWNPDANDGVYTLSAAGDKIYAGGWFSSVGGNLTGEFASIDTLTGVPDLGFTMKFNTNSYIKYSETSQDKLYLAGNFFNINGQTKNQFSEIEISTQTPGAWDPQLYNNNGLFGINMIKIIDNSLYIGGNFNNSGEFLQSYLVAFPKLATNTRTNYDKNDPLVYLQLYPNPATSHIAVELSEKRMSTSEAIISTLLGQEVLKKKADIHDGKLFLDISPLTTGNYLIRVIQDNKTYFGKFIKIQ